VGPRGTEKLEKDLDGGRLASSHERGAGVERKPTALKKDSKLFYRNLREGELKDRIKGREKGKIASDLLTKGGARKECKSLQARKRKISPRTRKEAAGRKRPLERAQISNNGKPSGRKKKRTTKKKRIHARKLPRLCANPHWRQAEKRLKTPQSRKGANPPLKSNRPPP